MSLASRATAQPPRTLDDFEPLAGWTAAPSDGVSLAITSDSGFRGRSMRLDFDFHGGGGYAVARKALAFDVPENYELTFRLRGDARPNNVELKLLADERGENVWWVNRRNVEFARDWRLVRYKKRHVEFAWGPSGGAGGLKHVAAIEIAITAGQGGKGTVWLDELAITPLEPDRPYDQKPWVTASATAPGSSPDLALDGDTATAWRSPAVGNEWLKVDFGRRREYGGLVIDWAPGGQSIKYDVETSDDGRVWTTAYRVRGGDGGRDYLYMPETDSRYLRIRPWDQLGPLDNRSMRAHPLAVREIAVQPLAWSASRNAFFEAVAKDAPRGEYPKYYYGAQSYWTVVGVNGDPREALFNEQGMLEVDKGSFSLEPFLFAGERLLTWADVTTSALLADGYLPVPSVEWRAGGPSAGSGQALALTITPFADGEPGKSTLWARYRVENRGRDSVAVMLYVAIRPFQVNPTAQFLNTPGGFAPVREIEYQRGGVVRVDGARSVVSVTPTSGILMAGFDQGGIVALLRRGYAGVDARTARIADSAGTASAALVYRLSLPAGASRTVLVAVSSGTGAPPRPAPAATAADAERLASDRLDAVLRDWRQSLDRVQIELPPAGRRVIETLKANLAYILINRDGPAIQPGSRSYERSWIRDGSLTSAALLRLGQPEVVRQFIEWYAPHQYASGKVPCCVDYRGADPVPEHDSHGELIYVIAEYFRYTRDTAFLAKMWPHVAGAVAYIDTLRRSRMTDVYRTNPDSVPYYGLVPQSISHEGYSAKPMHSYWDDAFVMRGLKDAAFVASVLGKPEAARYAAARDEFRRNLMDSYRRAMAARKIDFLPGSVELGDFDATSTTVAVAPGGELANLPQPALTNTFERYYQEARTRAAGTREWDAYTPYELRTVGTFVRLGWTARAHEMLDFFFANGQRPAAWRQWAEVVYRDSTATRFIGDMPHTWVGSDYVRSVMDMFAYERESDSSLVVGTGVPEAWVAADPGVVVRRLPTHYGTLDLAMRGEAGGRVRVTLGGDLRVPPGGVVVRSPRSDREEVVRRLPAVVVLEP
ncbi:MAG TPA: discoidin domain-containing protein [Gemmatimonadaceae bacterium]|nr:discoidin domain-containing protein [Gemmatimonadaceae bacterium]